MRKNKCSINIKLGIAILLKYGSLNQKKNFEGRNMYLYYRKTTTSLLRA